MGEPNDVITPAEAGTLAGLLRERIARTPERVAYRQYDPEGEAWVPRTWAQVGREVARWQAALLREGLSPGDRVAVMLRNCQEWVIFDQACLGLGLITVPLYTDDRPDNIAYVLGDAGARLLVLGGRMQWRRLQEVRERLDTVQRVVSVQRIEPGEFPEDPRLMALEDWAPPDGGGELTIRDVEPDALATIVYTSGTTGRSKGVMLTHQNILQNAYAAQQCAPMGPEDLFLSFLPLSHTLERTGGCYMPMMVGAQVAFARSVQGLSEDLQNLRPTVLISVPRIYELIYGRVTTGLESRSALERLLFRLTVDVGWRRFQHQQGRGGWHPGLLLWPLLKRLVADKVTARLGGRLRYAVCGGAPLPPPIARFFIGLGLPVYHGFGMTEASPVVSVNRPDDNLPASVGRPLPGVEVRIGPHEELLIRGPSVMQGYWNNPEATAETLDAEGWLHSGDKARFDEQGHIFIIGRIKDILVLGNGEKVPPADMEMAITLDPLFEQAMVLGEGRPFLSALVVLNREEWRRLAQELELDPEDAGALQGRKVEKALLARVAEQLKEFHAYAQIRRLTPVLESWEVDNGLLTPTMKLKRRLILDRYAPQIEAMYAAHNNHRR
ncbi:AMP-dependent synthetase/ligase [Ectothiorhodospira mobilis]|uniref:AMP-dependent synthetase/ligase n=1 Tax=Ectothiorhodospira mobilis TaxID=195064 RepID=UPI001903139C|nr:long-chain fatty acid--CoA ligase [Ectothiorhodospira mobilis]MBK1691771.1 long-chain fatty acid--CoA ligase [Ectothiorhodospira mobilis]